ncbi:hypothetical protein [Planctomycetes bacterium TBK1r]|uniref:Uncharacterized protein n=1 Tax=Stieleria magnilauensis TaxID=2527963 RepID=A0ABX5Y3J5_9BACT|nr:hypothetical protein TBK1r_78980 [Planctomycetes bacterium TBK1r]
MTARPFALIELLLEHSVPLVIIGGHAVNSYGYARATEVTDIIFDRTESSEQALYSALSKINAFWISVDIDPVTRLEKTVQVDLQYIRSHRFMMLGTDLGYLDVFDYLPGVDDEPTSVAFEDVHVVGGLPYVSLRLLRKMKRASGRGTDLLDLENLPTEAT